MPDFLLLLAQIGIIVLGFALPLTPNRRAFLVINITLVALLLLLSALGGLWMYAMTMAVAMASSIVHIIIGDDATPFRKRLRIGVAALAVIIAAPFIYQQPLDLMPVIAFIAARTGESFLQMRFIRLGFLTSGSINLLYLITVGSYSIALSQTAQLAAVLLSFWLYRKSKDGIDN